MTIHAVFMIREFLLSYPKILTKTNQLIALRELNIHESMDFVSSLVIINKKDHIFCYTQRS